MMDPPCVMDGIVMTATGEAVRTPTLAERAGLYHLKACFDKAAACPNDEDETCKQTDLGDTDKVKVDDTIIFGRW